MEAALTLFALLLPWILAFLSVSFTIGHTIQELEQEGGPIWRYLGFPVSDVVGFGGLVAFAGLQAVLAWVGYVDGCRLALVSLAAVAVIYLIASHVIWALGSAPVASALQEVTPRLRSDMPSAERASR